MLSKKPKEILLPLEELGVTDSMFEHQSELHGAAHVNRVMFHALALCRTMGYEDIFPEVWAAVFLHDLARTHDGPCHRHGLWAVEKKLPGLEEKFRQAGVKDMSSVCDAVVRHSLAGDEGENSGNRVCAVLKDADALDRCRLGDLDASMLRLERSRVMVHRAEQLLEATNGITDWMAIWNKAVALYNPNLGFHEKYPPQFDETERPTDRMLRRVQSGSVIKGVVTFMDVITDTFKTEPNLKGAMSQLDFGTFEPVIYMADDKFAEFNKSGLYLNIWDTGPTWHTTYNDNPLDARAWNEVRLFGESCRHLAHGVLYGRKCMIDSADHRLREMYGTRRVHLHPKVLESASFTLGDNQLARFAAPYRDDYVRASLATIVLRGGTKVDDLNGGGRRLLALFTEEPFRYIELQYHDPIKPEHVVSVQ